jgi:subtilisin family serine protease
MSAAGPGISLAFGPRMQGFVPSSLLLGLLVTLHQVPEVSAQHSSDRFSDGPDGTHVVLIVSAGFDLDHPALADRVEAHYRVRCDATAGADYDRLFGRGASLDERRRFFVESMSEHVSRRCWLEPGAEEHSLGTATAAIVAANNPRVRLVLVSDQRALTSRVLDGPCPSPHEARLQAEMLDDLQPAELGIQPGQSADPVNGEIAALAVRHGALLQLNDLAVPARNHQVAMLPGPLAPWFQVDYAYGLSLRLKSACWVTDLRPLWAAYVRFEQRLLEASLVHSDRAPLQIHPAGNGRVEVNQPEDLVVCTRERPTTWFVVGAHADSRPGPGQDMAEPELSALSNRGDCVDTHAPGEDIPVATAGGGWQRSHGTALAAALFARHITASITPGEEPARAAELLRDRLREQPFLSAASVADYLQYAESQLPWWQRGWRNP